MALSSKLPWELANTKWAAEINPVLANPIVNGSILSDVVLAIGVNTINHLLGRKLVGYLVILKSSGSVIYDNQATNQTPDKTLILNSSAKCTVSLYVF